MLAPASPDLAALPLVQAMDDLGRGHRPTPIVPVNEARAELFAKLESQNPAGSVKDRPAWWVLRQAASRGELTRASTVVESSSGNFALALATYCHALGVPFVPVIDPNTMAVCERRLRQMCRRVVKVETRDDTGGFLKTRLEAVDQVMAESPDSFWPCQYRNLESAEAHYRTTGKEIAEALPDVDLVFVAVSTAGTLNGVSRRLREDLPDARVVAVDTVGSVIFGGPPARRHVPGVGSSIVPPLLKDADVDDVVMVPERDAVVGCQTLLRDHGLFVGGSSGTAYAAVKRYLSTLVWQAPRLPRVLFLCADGGAAYRSTLFDPEWCKRFEPGSATT